MGGTVGAFLGCAVGRRARARACFAGAKPAAVWAQGVLGWRVGVVVGAPRRCLQGERACEH